MRQAVRDALEKHVAEDEDDNNAENSTQLVSPTPISPQVHFVRVTDEDFKRERATLLRRILTEKDHHPTGKHFIYWPRGNHKFSNATTENIIKMWHGQEAVFDLMLKHAILNNKHYARVAMLRNDVVFVTPIDIYRLPKGVDSLPSYDTKNQYAVVPGFAKHPVNDRMIYGPFQAVRTWAMRFGRLEQHVQDNFLLHNGATVEDGIHDELFLHRTIFPAIAKAGFEIVRDDEVCFLRARADFSIRMADCDDKGLTNHNQVFLQHLLNRSYCRTPEFRQLFPFPSSLSLNGSNYSIDTLWECDWNNNKTKIISSNILNTSDSEPIDTSGKLSWVM